MCGGTSVADETWAKALPQAPSCLNWRVLLAGVQEVEELRADTRDAAPAPKALQLSLQKSCLLR
jgi:hypothetical protein